MGTIYATSPRTGKTYSVSVAGSSPTQAEDAEIRSYIDQVEGFGVAPTATSETSETGNLIDFGKGLASGFARGFADIPGGIASLAAAGLSYIPGDQGEEEIEAFGQGITDAARSGIDYVVGPLDDNVASKSGQAAGSLASFLVPFAGGAKVASLAGAGVKATRLSGSVSAGTMGVALGAQNQVDRIARVLEEGGEVDSRELSIIMGGGIGATEALPVGKVFGAVGNMLKKVPKESKESAIKTIGQRLKSAGVAGLQEGGQEVVAAILQDLTEKNMYNPDLELSASAYSDDAIYGGGAGATFNFLLETIGGRRVRKVVDARKQLVRDQQEEGAEVVGNVARAEASIAGPAGVSTPLLPAPRLRITDQSVPEETISEEDVQSDTSGYLNALKSIKEQDAINNRSDETQALSAAARQSQIGGLSIDLSSLPADIAQRISDSRLRSGSDIDQAAPTSLREIDVVLRDGPEKDKILKDLELKEKPDIVQSKTVEEAEAEKKVIDNLSLAMVAVETGRVTNKDGTISRPKLQRELKIGVAEAQSIIDKLARQGELNPVGRNKKDEVVYEPIQPEKTLEEAVPNEAEQRVQQFESTLAELRVQQAQEQRTLEDMNRRSTSTQQEQLELEAQQRRVSDLNGRVELQQNGLRNAQAAVEPKPKPQVQVRASDTRSAVSEADQALPTDDHKRRLNTIANSLRKYLAGIGLADVDLTTTNVIDVGVETDPETGKEMPFLVEGEETKGVDGRRIITLAMEIYDPNLSDAELEQRLAGVLNHEIIHSMKALGLFTDAEYQSLVKAAESRKYTKRTGGRNIQRDYTFLDRAEFMYPDLDPEGQQEEAIAEMFRAYTDGRLKVVGKPKGLFKRMVQFIKRIFGGYNEAGFKNVDELFSGITSGQVGRRQRNIQRELTQEANFLQDTDARYSRSAVIPTDDFLRGVQFQNNKGSNSSDQKKITARLFKNREVPAGTMVTVRPNLNGFVTLPDGSKSITQTMHPAKTYGTAVGYDSVMALTDSELRVSPQKRADIYNGTTTTGKKQDKVPMAGGYGAYAPIERAEVERIVNSAMAGKEGYHTLSFNPGSKARGVVGHHLFVDESETAVKSVKGTAIHLGTKVYVNGDLEYWTEEEAPKPVGDLPTSVKYKKPEPSETEAAKQSRKIIRIEVPNVDSREVDRISQRLPTAVNATEDGVNNAIRMELADLLADDKLKTRAAQLIRNYNIITEEEAENATDEELIEILTNRLADNLEFVYDNVDPETRERSKLWYMGANRIANEIAKKYGIEVRQVAGVMAALSPQKDWYQNVSLAERTIDIKMTKMDVVPTPEMLATAQRIFGKNQYQPMLDIIFRQGRNMPLSEYNDAPLLEAMFIRIYDETYNDRGYQIVSPDGEDLGFARTKNGQRSKTGWGSNKEITKAVVAMNDPDAIVLEMGDRHKVRNFYNNIIAPESLEGDVTSDTHAVAAAHLKPLSGASTEVHHNFGTSPTKPQQIKNGDWFGATANSSVSGLKGTYSIYVEAHRRAAQRKGVLPREMQSITWEAVRGLFLPSFKGNANNVQKINDIWNNYRKGLISLDQVRQEVMNEAGDQGRFRPPSWEGSDRGSLKSPELAVDEGELSGAIVSRGSPRDYGGDGSRASGASTTRTVEPNIGNLTELETEQIGKVGEVIGTLPKYSRRRVTLPPEILGIDQEVETAATGIPVQNRFATVSAPVRFPDKNLQRFESLFGVIKEGGGNVPVILFAGEHNNETNGGSGISHILSRGHEQELIENSKFKNIESAIQQLFFAWHKQGFKDGPNVISEAGTLGGDRVRSVDGSFRSISKKDMNLVWLNPSHGSPPFKVVLNYGLVSDPDVKREFGFTRDIPVYSVTTAYPLLTAKQKSDIKQSRSVVRVPVNFNPPSIKPITALVDENEEAYQRLTYNNVSKILAPVARKFWDSNDNAEARLARTERFITKFQDAMLPVGKMVDELKADGFTVTEGLDPYMREERSHGLIGFQLEQNTQNLYEPLRNTIAEIDVSEEKISELTGGNTPRSYFLADAVKVNGERMAIADAYMYALHAKERNQYVQDKYSRGLGSGMSETEADAIINWVDSLDLQNKQLLNAVRDYIKQIVANTNAVRRDGGLMAEEYQFENYVPLRGNLDPESEISEDGDGLARTYTKRKPDLYGGKRSQDPRIAAGRGTAYAEDIIGTAMMQNQTSIVNAERNKVGQTFLKMVQDDKVDTKDIAEVVTDVTDQIRDNVLGVKVNGQQDPVNILIFDDRIARAMKGAYGDGVNRGGAVVRHLTKLNRYLSSINTTYNPEFMVTNFARDLETALVNIGQYDGKGLTKEILFDAPKAVIGIGNHIRARRKGEAYDQDNYWSQKYQEFMEDGGKNATNQIDTVKDQVNNIKDILGDISNNTMAGKFGLARTQFLGKGVRSILGMLDDANTAVENGVRVATYDALLKRGFSRARAAQAARNITVNFAKAGEERAMANALYLFYNASVQGSFALYNAMIRSSRVRKIWGSMILYGILQDQFLAAISNDEDEDGKPDYDELSDYTLEHNLIMNTFGLSDEKYIKIPLGYGINSAVNLGRALSRTQRGEYTIGQASNSIFGTLLESISPIGGVNDFDEVGDYAIVVSPTVIEPVTSLFVNRDFDGSPVYKEGSQFGLQTPASQRHWTTASTPSKIISKTLNDLTGGSDVTPGAANVSPDIIDYIFGFYTGAAGKFAQRTAEAPLKIVDALKGDYEGDIIREIPFLRKVGVNPSAFEDVGTFIENRDKVLYAGRELQYARQKGDVESEARIRQKYAKELSIYGQLKAMNNARNQLMRQRKQIENNPRIPDSQKDPLIKRYREKINLIVKKANALLRDAGVR